MKIVKMSLENKYVFYLAAFLQISLMAVLLMLGTVVPAYRWWNTPPPPSPSAIANDVLQYETESQFWIMRKSCSKDSVSSAEQDICIGVIP